MLYRKIYITKSASGGGKPASGSAFSVQFQQNISDCRTL
jgi:hypothetical protein